RDALKATVKRQQRTRLPSFTGVGRSRRRSISKKAEEILRRKLDSREGAYSGASCPPIPIEVVHLFRGKLSRDSEAMLSTFPSLWNGWTTCRNRWTRSRNLSGQ